MHALGTYTIYMATDQSLDESKIIAALLHDVHSSHGVVFNTRSLKNTLNKCLTRLRREGIGFLTKTLPRLGKAFDKALAGDTPLNCHTLRFKSQRGTDLPSFLGEFFNRVLKPDGTLLPDPCINSVRVIRQICYLFYKYKLPYTDEQVQQVLQKFERTEEELTALTDTFRNLSGTVGDPTQADRRRTRNSTPSQAQVVRVARLLLKKLFCNFDPKDIVPRHGPGAVATKQQLWDKYVWTNVSAKITEVYPLDAYFYASLGHFCDTLDSINAIGEETLPARVCLVPKDSRGPRLISCEPVDFQWVQQGLGTRMRQLVENNELTKFNVFFTDQGPNQRGALLGSSTGRYATLDLNEASDRIHLDLVRLLYPEDLVKFLEACRTSSTVLPDGRELKLNKFAPMGSNLCFPILAITIWALLTAAAPDMDTRESILVYGDDVIVPTAYAVNAIELLESFGLKINRDKSCIKGLFRESCGVDAFKGETVTPVRLRTLWSSSRSPDVYTSWIAYANSFWDRRYYTTYDVIVGALTRIYGPIPDESLNIECPRLRENHNAQSLIPKRVNRSFQKIEYRVWDIRSPRIRKTLPGWLMLLRYFTEFGAAGRYAQNEHNRELDRNDEARRRQAVRDTEWEDVLNILPKLLVSTYTRRKASMLVKRWR